jgi:hypothetical protein
MRMSAMKRRIIGATTVAMLAVTPALAQADYNRDGTVDGADYIAWTDFSPAAYGRYAAWPNKVDWYGFDSGMNQ